MFIAGLDDAARAATQSRQRILLFIAIAMAAVLVMAASFGAANANAAFSVTEWKVTPTNLQAGSHPGLNLKITPDAVAGDQTSDDLKSVLIDLPAGLLLNPQAVATGCGATALTADTCPAASLVGTISFQYKIGNSTITSPGSVYSMIPDATSAINFGFVVRPTSSYKKFSFSGTKVTGLASLRSGADVDHGMTISIPALPTTVKANLGYAVSMTIANFSIDLNARSGSTQTGPYFVVNPTRCTPAISRVTLASTKGVSITRTSSFSASGCNTPTFRPTFAIAATDTTQSASTGFTAAVTIPTAEADIQSSEFRSISIALAPASTLNTSVINSNSAICTDTQLAADACPAASQIGTAKATVPYLPSEMTGAIYLTANTGEIKIGYVLRGARAALSIMRGSIAPDPTVSGRLSVSLLALPQMPISSATLNFTAKLITNPPTCNQKYVYAALVGYTGAQAGFNASYPVTGCPPPPNTTIAGPTTSIRYNNPVFTFASPDADVTFECRIDSIAFFACVSPYQMSNLIDGYHHFEARAVKNGVVDPTPALAIFIVDRTPPPLTISAPATGAAVAGDTVTVNFTSEAGATTECRLDQGATLPCTSPATFSNLAIGPHYVLVKATDEAGNGTRLTRNFTMVSAQGPVVTITSPVVGSTTEYEDLIGTFSATSPTGNPVTYDCKLFKVAKPSNSESLRDEGPCTSGVEFGFRLLEPSENYRFEVKATDANGLIGLTSTTFIGGNPRPYAPGNPISGIMPGDVITDRTPTFTVNDGANEWQPVVTYECDIVPVGAAPDFKPCGTSPLGSFTPASNLPNGEYRLYSRSRDVVDLTRVSTNSVQSFTVADWAATYTATTTTQQAGAHPDLDVAIKPAAGQFRSLDMLLPKGLIGSLNSFSKCPLAQVPTASDCPANTQVGTVSTLIQIVALPIDAIGRVYLTEPQVPGDAAGLTIFVQSPLPDKFDSVVIPLRLRLVNNSQQMRVSSDSIPTSTAYDEDGTKVNAQFYVLDFAMHLNGSTGAPFPLLTNPSSCAAGSFSTVFGDTVDQKTAALPIPYQATGCAAVQFAPTFEHTFTKPIAGSTTGVSATIAAPEGSSSFRQIRVLEPPMVAPNFPAFGDALDQCPGSSAPLPTSLFDPTNCPPQSLVGRMEIKSPVLPTSITGDVYLINKSPLPWFGVVIKAPQYGVDVRLTGVTSTPQVVQSCDAESEGFCQSQIAVSFGNAPDLPVTSVKFDLSGPTRTGIGGAQLSGDMVVLAEPGDSTCVSPASVVASIAPNSGTPAAVRSVQQLVAGC